MSQQDYSDSEMTFQDWSYNRDDYNFRVSYDSFQYRGCKHVNRKEVIKSGFLGTPRYLDLATMLAQSDHYQKHHLEVSSPSFCIFLFSRSNIRVESDSREKERVIVIESDNL